MSDRTARKAPKQEQQEQQMGAEMTREMADALGLDEEAAGSLTGFVNRLVAYIDKLAEKDLAMVSNLAIEYIGPGADRPEKTDWDAARIVGYVYRLFPHETTIRVYCPLRSVDGKGDR